MNKNEARVRVRFDTSQAKADLAELMKHAQEVGSAIHGGGGREGGGSSAGGAAMGFGRSFGLGAAFGAGVEAIRGPVSSTMGSAISEGLGVYGQQLQRAMFGDMGAEARASETARAQTREAFAHVAGRAGAVPSGAESYYKAVFAIERDKEKGVDLINANAGMRNGPDWMNPGGWRVSAEHQAESKRIADETRAGFDRVVETIKGALGL